MSHKKASKSMIRDMEVVILCGGKGTRMGEAARYIPKPLIKIGQKPILWHILNYYSSWGINNFILCLGYKGHKIRQYFSNNKKWNITFVDTGLGTNTGGRIKKVKKYIKRETFFATYGDGVSDINLVKLLKYHKEKGKIATVTAVRPMSQFGVMVLNNDASIKKFEEKPRLDHWVNGGFFVFEKGIFSYLSGENDILEKGPFEKLAKNNDIVAYKHAGFWKCMDTYKDNLELNNMYESGKAVWANWRR